jgi:hypothetical protein
MLERFRGWSATVLGPIARLLGLRVNHPIGSESLERAPNEPASRADAGDPPLSKLGGKQWEQMKLKARRAAQALAGELINLYAERKRRAGHAFPEDDEWPGLYEFDQAFFLFGD